MRSFILLGAIVFLTIIKSFSQNFEWAVGMGGSGNDLPKCIATDLSGNVYSAGRFESSTADCILVNGDTTITSLLISSTAGSFITKHNNSGDLIWAKSFGYGLSEIGDMVLDHDNNLYMVGRFHSPTDFDPDTGLAVITPGPSGDLFLLKLDSNANLIWVKTTNADSGSAVRIEDMDIDDSANLAIGGYFRGTLDMDLGAGIYNLSGAGSSFCSIAAKLDSAGNLLWLATVDSSSISSVKFDIEGSILAQGRFGKTLDFDPDSTIADLFCIGMFVWKLDHDGNYVWAKCISTLSGTVDQYYTITTDYLGDIYIIGTFAGTVDFDPGWENHSLTSTGTMDVFILKLSKFGDYLWANHFGPSDEYYSSVAIDIDYYQNIFVTGQFEGTVDFDPGTGVSEKTSTGFDTDIFIAKYNSSGHFLWVEKIGKSGSERPTDIEVANNGSIYLITPYGFSSGSDVDPGPGTVILNHSSPGGWDVLLLKLIDSTSVIGIENLVNKDPFIVYPNPFNDQVTINGIEEPTQIKLFNSLGEEMGSWELNTNNTTIPIFGLKPGIYFLRLQTKTHFITKKIIKN